MNVMELVHVRLHPTLISTYNLGLSTPGMNINTNRGNAMSGMNAVSKSTTMDKSPAMFNH